ncbi:HDR078Wp [Eremothecium sinecaudum]|uniref:HDR078Wp n=1 Tax=Eremothecium sinecaudum TaxID=45286 RepID=A0A120K294_9SACH|nr:HDR078Wp [Eremothecium sinecaudum]AMD20820.1 HDR078Wp [Eremothecium sinecaudum]
MDKSTEQYPRENLIDSDAENDELVQDWSEIAKVARKSRQAVIPRRGEKDYEPDGTIVQESMLSKAKSAFFDTISSSLRGSTVKNLIKAYWIEDRRMARIPQPRGTFMNTMGKVDRDGQGWLELHEFVYLVERGSITPYAMITLDNGDETEILLSLQDVYSYFKTDEELDEFSVYAQLKRLGYIVISTDNEPAEKTSLFPIISNRKRYGIMNSFYSLFRLPEGLLNIPFYHPLHFLINRYTSYPQIYNSLSKLVPFYAPPKTLKELREERCLMAAETNVKEWKISFNVWKPQSNFKKKNPGLPDFQLVIYNKNDNSNQFPSFAEFKNIFRRLDYKFEFLEEIKIDDDETTWGNFTYTNGVPTNEYLKPRKITGRQRKPGFNDEKRKKTKTYPIHVQKIIRLKEGFRSFILAVIDDGLISFVRIAESDFGSTSVWHDPSKVSSRKGRVERVKKTKPCN